MLKFVLGAFLFLGLAVNAQRPEDQNAQVSEAFDMDNKLQADELSSATKSEEFNAESAESEESEEEDYSAANENEAVSETADDQQFDKDDEFRAQVLENDDEQNQDCQDDESGSSSCTWRPRCRNFLLARRNFRRWRGRCFSCLRGRRNYCKRVCGAYRRIRAGRFRQCRRFFKQRMASRRARLKRNWNKIAFANKKMQQNRATFRFYFKRARNFGYKNAVNQKAQQVKKYKNNVAAYRVNVKNFKQFRAKASYFAGKVRRYAYLKRKYPNNRRFVALYNRFRALYFKYSRLTGKARRAAIQNINNFRAAASRLKFLNKILGYYAKMKQAKINFFKWFKRKKALLRLRRRFVIEARKYYRSLVKKCLSAVKRFYWRCRLCNWRCGGRCNLMQKYYAIAIVNAHKCRVMSRWLCRNKAIAKKKFYIWRRDCILCLRKTRPQLRKLRCSGRCQSSYKFAMLWRYYKKKC